jgi:16S rRNA (cytosine967-C5)-methyltransferase
MALYQIYVMDRVPESAAVNEAVKQAATLKQKYLVRFVNGILREVCRRKHLIPLPDRETDLVSYLSISYSYPPWLVRKWIRELGEDPAERLLEAGNRVPNVHVRVHTMRIGRTSLISELEKEGLKAKPTTYSQEGIVIEGSVGSVSRWPYFKKGLFQVQSEAAQICSHLLHPRPGQRILDLYAGLGGKTTHLCQLMEDQGSIIAIDKDHCRLLSLCENKNRMGLKHIAPIVADADSELTALFNRSFDKILIDAPCSGLGVLCRHPDGKWNRKESDIQRLAHLQGRSLDKALSLLRRRGKMLYVTCTVSREENEGVVQAFLERNPNVTMVDLRPYAPGRAIELIDAEGFFRCLPHVHGLDGFFAALFRRH